MKKLLLICLLALSITQIHAQLQATTIDGRKVILNRNGTWRFSDRNDQGNWSTDALALYNDSYKYAYDILYATEFFKNDRVLKSNTWAKDYVSKNLVMPVGQLSLEDWFNTLYDIGFNNIYKTLIFKEERKNYAISWAEKIIKDRAFFEDPNLDLITMHRQAYDVAYKYIYQKEFFEQDRKKNSLQWANDFIKR